MSVCVLPHAANSNKSHYPCKVLFVCVSVIRGRIQKIARMQSIGVLIDYAVSQILGVCQSKLSQGQGHLLPWVGQILVIQHLTNLGMLE